MGEVTRCPTGPRAHDRGHDLRHYRFRSGACYAPAMNEEPVPASPPSPVDSRRGRLVAGGVLLAVALLALLGDRLPWSWNSRLTLALLGVAFVAWAGLARTSGLLVPGGILIGVGVGSWLQASYGPAAFLWSMAGGFLLISLLSLALFGPRKSTAWTVWPAAGLAFAGTVVAGGSEARAVLGFFRHFWPWLVLAGALALIVSGLRKNP